MTGPNVHTLYLCYFGVREPLVQTQVLPYLRELAADGLRVSLLTFEPEMQSCWNADSISAMRARLQEEGISWHSLPYHKRPSLPATLYDIWAGARFARRLARREQVQVMHARSYVAALMGNLAQAFTSGQLIFDIRGLMAEEYVDAGTWPAGGLLFRLTKAAEQRLLRVADGFVVLTHRARAILFPQANATDEWANGESDTQGRPVTVIPCCVDPAQFPLADMAGREAARQALGMQGRRVLAYVGSLGGWYLTEETLELFAQAKRQDSTSFALILTQRDTAAAAQQLRDKGFADGDFLVTSAAPSEVASYLAAADIALSLIKPCYSKQASSPTKVAEYLACGVPIISTAGIGDLDELFAQERVGVVLRGFTETDYGAALWEADELRADPELRARCRRVAVANFDLKRVGGARYRRLYQRLLKHGRTEVHSTVEQASICSGLSGE